MASSDKPDDHFGVPPDKVFGSLKSVKSSGSASLWSVSDTKAEKRKQEEKAAGKDEEIDVVLGSEDREGLKVESGNGESEVKGGVGDRGDGGVRGGLENANEDDGKKWEIRPLVRLDRALNGEEEENMFNKLAVGRDNADDLIFMNDAADLGPRLDSHIVLTQSHDTSKDPPANLSAEHVELKEDKAGAWNFDTSQSHDKTNLVAKASEHQVKSILKRSSDETDPKSQKRVKFDLSKNDYNEAPIIADDNFSTGDSLIAFDDFSTGDRFILNDDFSTGDNLVDIEVSEDESLLNRDSQEVPGYVLRPSDHTHHTLHSSSDIIVHTKSQACVEFLEQLKSSKVEELAVELQDPVEVLKSPTVVSRKKASDANVADRTSQKKNPDNPLHPTGFPIGIAAGESHQDESGTGTEELDAHSADKSSGSNKASLPLSNKNF